MELRHFICTVLSRWHQSGPRDYKWSWNTGLIHSDHILLTANGRYLVRFVHAIWYPITRLWLRNTFHVVKAFILPRRTLDVITPMTTAFVQWHISHADECWPRITHDAHKVYEATRSRNGRDRYQCKTFINACYPPQPSTWVHMNSGPYINL